jgi:PadR family transcriptional regulator, regulatory protein AphA
MRFFWPRAESRIFAQARRLEPRGLAETTTSYVGRRQRTTYSITPNGHAALREWLATPPRATTLECEALLRIMLADFADPSQVQVALAQVRADAHAILEVSRVVGPEYLRGDAPCQNQLHVRAHVLDFLSDHALMLLEWADRTEAITSEWAAVSSEQRQATARRLIEACLAQYPEP